MDQQVRQAVAEFVGAFALTFIGAGAIVVDGLTNGSVGLLGIAIAHGLAIGVMVTALGPVSGGHFNPAVTLAALATKRMNLKRAGIYWVSQLLGALVAAGLLLVAFTGQDVGALGIPALGANVGVLPGILIEAILTFFLVWVIFGSAMDETNGSAVAGLAIGLTITMDILMGGPLTGAAMNPSRWFGVAVATGNYANWYVWWIGPAIGALVAGLLYHYVVYQAAETA